MTFSDFRERLAEAREVMADMWSDRNEHLANFQQGLSELPGRVQNAPREQQITGAVGFAIFVGFVIITVI